MLLAREDCVFVSIKQICQAVYLYPNISDGNQYHLDMSCACRRFCYGHVGIKTLSVICSGAH